MHYLLRKKQGFTLIEMLLVMVIVSMLIVMGMGYMQQRANQLRIDRASTQMEQILNAGLSYYISNGAWPTNLACLQGTGGALCQVSYLPNNITNPWGRPYQVATASGSPSPLLYVSTQIPTQDAFGIASTLVSRLPLSYATTAPPGGIPVNNGSCVAGSNPCTVVASVNIPGQNLNNARAINFAGLYHNGACVPVPTCPVDANGYTMKPEIIVAPVAVSGMPVGPQTGSNCNETDQSGCNAEVYPISSFAAYATPQGKNGGWPETCAASGGNPGSDGCYTDYTKTVKLPTGDYWRVCLSTVTEKGVVAPDNTTWGMMQGTIMAITRCVPTNEPSGSGFTVWSGT